MTPIERCLVVEPNVAPPQPPARPRWHSRWGLVIAFQAGMVGVLALRPTPAIAPAVAREAEPVMAPAPPPLAAATRPEPPPASAPRAVRPPVPARSRVASASPVAEPDRLVEVEITSEPAGATVRIGEQVAGTTPLSAYLPSKTTTIHFELEGHQAQTNRWTPRSGRRVTAVLAPTL